MIGNPYFIVIRIYLLLFGNQDYSQYVNQVACIMFLYNQCFEPFQSQLGHFLNTRLDPRIIAENELPMGGGLSGRAAANPIGGRTEGAAPWPSNPIGGSRPPEESFSGCIGRILQKKIEKLDDFTPHQLEGVYWCKKRLQRNKQRSSLAMTCTSMKSTKSCI